MTTTPRTRTLALAGFAAPVWFTAMVAIQAELQAGYDHVTMPISALAAWPMGWLQNLTFCVAGLLVIAFVVALHRSVHQSPRGRAGHVLLLIGGAELAMNGAFPWEMVDGVPGEPTTHAASAVTTFITTALGMIAFSPRMATDERWHGLARYTAWSGVLLLVLFLVLGLFAIEAGAPLHRWIGLIQRGLVAVWFVWMIVVALRIRAGGRRA
jgi:hypothetical membrane protein